MQHGFKSRRGHSVRGDHPQVEAFLLDAPHGFRLASLAYLVGLRAECVKMGRDAAGQNGNVVSPLEHADHSTVRMRLGHGDQFLSQDLEVLDLQSQVADRILGVSVEARTDQNELGSHACAPGDRVPNERRRGTRSEAYRRAGGC